MPSSYDTIALVLSSAPPIGGAGSEPAGPAGQGATGGTQAAPSPFPGTFMFLILGLFVVMIFMSTMTQRKEKKKRAEMLNALGRHDRVQTAGGLIGTVIEVKDDEVILKVDEATNTRIHFSRSAVQSILKKASSREPSNSLEPAEVAN